MEEHHINMRRALELAREAMDGGESPVGCVITRGGEVLAFAANRRERDKSATAHAEILAIEHACKALGSWRLENCTLYVTLEPCPMCAGAVVNARLKRVVFGAYDPKAGAFGGRFDLNTEGLNHRPEVIGGVLEDECAAVLGEFFRERRKIRALSAKT